MKSMHTAGFRLLIMLLVISAIMVLPAMVLANGMGRTHAQRPIVSMAVPPGTAIQGNMTIRLTSDGIIKQATSNQGGFYVVTLRNDTSSYRGIRMTGNDIAGSPYVRYSRVLAPGQSQTFGWFFPTNSSTQVVDLLRCEHAARTCAVADTGNMSTVLNFG